MSKKITVEELAADLGTHLAEVKAGETLTIVDGDSAIATITPPALDAAHRGGVPYPFRNLQITPLAKPLSVDPVEILIEERERERSGKKHGF